MASTTTPLSPAAGTAATIPTSNGPSAARNLVLVYPTAPIDLALLKVELRKGLQNTDSRLYWWPLLARIPRLVGATAASSGTGSISKYPDIMGTAEALPKRMNEPMLDYKYQMKYDGQKPEQEFFTATLKKLMYLLSSQRLLDTNEEHEVYCFEPMARIIIYHMRRIDLCFLIASDLLADKDKYLNPSQDAHSAMLNTFRDMLNNFMPKTFQQLSVMGALDEKYLDLMFVGMFTELLPPDVVLRIMDAFLLEGVKILYRHGLALIRGYKAQIKSGKYQTATDFWLHIKADACAFSSDPALSRSAAEITAAAATTSTTASSSTASSAAVVAVASSIGSSGGGKVGEGALGPPGWGMLFRSIGLVDVLPAVDPFLIFAKAKNPELLRSNAMLEYPYDIGRSVFEKMRRPMSVSSSSIKSSMKRQGSITAADSSFSSGFSSSSKGGNNGTNSGNSSGGKLPESAESASRKGSLSTLSRKENVDYTGRDSVNSGVRSASMGTRRGSGTTQTLRSSVTGSNSNNNSSGAITASATAVTTVATTTDAAATAAAATNDLEKSIQKALASVSIAEEAADTADDDEFDSPDRPVEPDEADNEAAGKATAAAAVEKHAGINNSNNSNSNSSESAVAVQRICEQSNILTAAAASKLLAYLPLEPFEVTALSLLYSSDTDELNLAALYAKTENAAPCIVLVEVAVNGSSSSNGSDSNSNSGVAVVGAYTAVAISPPSDQPRGDVSTLCFRLDGAHAACYFSAGAKAAATAATTAATKETVFDATVAAATTAAVAVTSAEQQYVLATRDFLSFGCSAALNTAALRLNSDLAALFTGSSDTFQNPPLINAVEQTTATVTATSSATNVNVNFSAAMVRRIEVFSSNNSNNGSNVLK